jgi:hypothetical protein
MASLIDRNQTAAAWLTAAILCIAAPALVSPAAASERQVSVIGSSRIYQDVSSARNAAIAEGLLSAVERVALQMMPAESLKQNFEGISRILYDNRQDCILGYQVLKEISTGDHYRLLIRAAISEDKIETLLSEAGVSLRPEGMPRILLLLAEKHADDLHYRYWWQPRPVSAAQGNAARTLRQIFREKGFPLAAVRELPAAEIAAGIEAGPELTQAEAAAMARRADVDIAVFGKARAEETQNKMGGDIRTFAAKVSLSAVEAETETVLETVEKAGQAAGREIRAGSRDALAQAASRAGEVLAERIAEAWRQKARQAGPLEVHVKGDGDILKPLVRLRSALRRTEGVKDLQTRQRRRSEAVLVLTYEGRARELADKIILNTFEGFGVDIYKISPERIHIELITDPPITETDLGTE